VLANAGIGLSKPVELTSDGAGGTPITAWGRPVGVTTARDGALLISDDVGNKIWKVRAAAGGARRGN